MIATDTIAKVLSIGKQSKSILFFWPKIYLWLNIKIQLECIPKGCNVKFGFGMFLILGHFLIMPLFSVLPLTCLSTKRYDVKKCAT